MRRQSSSTLAAIVLLFWVILCAVPRESFAQTNDVALPETLKLSRLVDVAAEVSGQGYSYNPADLDATVTIRVPGGFTREQIPALLSHVLASRGYTTVRTPGSPLLSVVKLEQASGLATSADVPGVGEAAFITQVFEARHLSAKALADAARNLLSKPGGTANVIGDSNLVAVSDLVARVGEVRTLVARLDRPDGTTIREVPLRYLSAQQAVASIAQIVAKRESAGGRRLAGDVVAGSDGQSLLLVCTPEHEETPRSERIQTPNCDCELERWIDLGCFCRAGDANDAIGKSRQSFRWASCEGCRMPPLEGAAGVQILHPRDSEA
jgi:hypothetical protein